MMHKAQATLEFTLFFIIIAALSLGFISLWKGANDTIIRQQKGFNSSRVSAGSVAQTNPSSSSIPLNFTYNTIDPAIKNIGEEAYDLMSLEQINDNLEQVNQAISSIESYMDVLFTVRDTWRNRYDEAVSGEASEQSQINSLQLQLEEKQRELANSNCYVSDGVDSCAGLISEIDWLETQIGMHTNGYYTSQSLNGDGEWVTTYDYSNDQWMAVFGSREEWAEDYRMYKQYAGASPGNYKYGLYDNYTAGLLDWQTRKDYAYSELTEAQSNLDTAESSLADLKDMQARLLEAQASKTQTS
jgi:hypothetical protein